MKPIWNKLSVLRGLTGSRRVLHAELRNTPVISEVDMARRWARARHSAPDLLGDVLRLGGILNTQPMQDADILPLDPYRMAYEAGRRDFALQLASMMSLGIQELNDLMENPDE